jgi:hypothetical protein
VLFGEEVHGHAGGQKTEGVGELEGVYVAGSQELEDFGEVVAQRSVIVEDGKTVTEAHVGEPARIESPAPNTPVQIQQAVQVVEAVVRTQVGWSHEGPQNGQREAQHDEIAPVHTRGSEELLHSRQRFPRLTGSRPVSSSSGRDSAIVPCLPDAHKARWCAMHGHGTRAAGRRDDVVMQRCPTGDSVSGSFWFETL